MCKYFCWDGINHGSANPPNTDAPGTLREAVGLVAQRKGDATLMLHTGDVP